MVYLYIKLCKLFMKILVEVQLNVVKVNLSNHCVKCSCLNNSQQKKLAHYFPMCSTNCQNDVGVLCTAIYVLFTNSSTSKSTKIADSASRTHDNRTTDARFSLLSP